MGSHGYAEDVELFPDANVPGHWKWSLVRPDHAYPGGTHPFGDKQWSLCWGPEMEECWIAGVALHPNDTIAQPLVEQKLSYSQARIQSSQDLNEVHTLIKGLHRGLRMLT